MTDFGNTTPFNPSAPRPEPFDPRNPRNPHARGPRGPHRDRGGRGGWARGEGWTPGSNDDFTGRPSTPPEAPFGPFPFGFGPFAGGIFGNPPYSGRGGRQHPFGPFAGGRGSAGGTRTPRGGIRIGLLALLTDGDQNGYGLMKAFEAKSGGQWAPKPGTVYPALNQLLADALVSVNDDGVYSLTETGRAEAETNKAQTDALFARMAAGEQGADLFTASRHLAKALFQFAGEADAKQQAEVAAKLDELRKELYRRLGE